MAPTLCAVRLLLVRSIAAVIGAAILAVASSVGLRELVWAGFAALALSEVFALAELTRRHESAGARALLGTSEAMCGLGVSLLEPAAILVALAQVLYSVISSGIATVSLSLGKPLEQPRGEALRRLLSVAANGGLCVIALQAAGALDTRAALELSTRDLALLCMALVVVGSARALGDLALKAKWTK